jgi:catechol 2,3-dioxygenase-like lactoylglutathione lyase family enzyme
VTSPIVGLDHVQLAMPAGTEDTADRFYAGLLGLDVEAKPDALAGRGGRWYRAGATRIHLGVDQDFRPARKAHPALVVDDLAALASALDAGGHPFRPDGALEGHDRGYVDDPFGNRIELIQR